MGHILGQLIEIVEHLLDGIRRHLDIVATPSIRPSNHQTSITPSNDHISNVLKNLRWLSAENMWQSHAVTLLKKMLVTGQPESLRERVVTRGSVHGRATRQADALETPAIRAESGRRRFLFSAVSLYNSLPPTLRDLGPQQFKIQSKHPNQT